MNELLQQLRTPAGTCDPAAGVTTAGTSTRCCLRMTRAWQQHRRRWTRAHARHATYRCVACEGRAQDMRRRMRCIRLPLGVRRALCRVRTWCLMNAMPSQGQVTALVSENEGLHERLATATARLAAATTAPSSSGGGGDSAAGGGTAAAAAAVADVQAARLQVSADQRTLKKRTRPVAAHAHTHTHTRRSACSCLRQRTTCCWLSRRSSRAKWGAWGACCR
jgi:hypothetical protein